VLLTLYEQFPRRRGEDCGARNSSSNRSPERLKAPRLATATWLPGSPPAATQHGRRPPARTAPAS